MLCGFLFQLQYIATTDPTVIVLCPYYLLFSQKTNLEDPTWQQRGDLASLRTLFGFYFDPANADTKDDTWQGGLWFDSSVDQFQQFCSENKSNFTMVYGNLMAHFKYIHIYDIL